MITFEEVLNKAGETVKLDGKELSKKLIQIFCIPGVKKEKQIEAISSIILILLNFNNENNDFWNLDTIKEHVSKCL